MTTQVRTRFAPSPTGHLHIGGVRTALFNYLFAKKNSGEFALRIEDTDKKRSSVEFEKEILGSLKWLGLTWDGEVTRQSERVSLYNEYANKLINDGHAYYCYCSKERIEDLNRAQAKAKKPPRYDGHCRDLKEVPSDRKPVVRFKTSGKAVKFTDMVHGDMSFDSSAYGDFIIVSSEGEALYNLTVVVDDGLMEISHVLRGDDHLSNTPRQIEIFKALGFEVPKFGHMPLVTGEGGKPLSKRDKGFTIADLREDGYHPKGIINSVARLGWSLKEGLMTLEEIAEAFDTKFSKSASRFDIKVITNYSKDALAEDGSETYIAEEAGGSNDKDKLLEVLKEVKGNASTVKEAIELAKPFIEDINLEGAVLEKLKTEPWSKVTRSLKEELKSGDCEDIINRVKEKTGTKGRDLFMPIRLALTGEEHGIELDKVIKLLGKEESLKRLESL